jgi:hypothetical protein
MGPGYPGKTLLVADILSNTRSKYSIHTTAREVESYICSKKHGTPFIRYMSDPNGGSAVELLDTTVFERKNLQRNYFNSDLYNRYYKPNLVILICDYDETDLLEKNIPDIIKKAPGPVYVSTRKRDISLYNGATAIVVSENDFKLSKSSNVEPLIVTLGKDGASYNEKIYPTTPYERGDNIGCREAFFTFFSYVHLITNDIEYAIRVANVAASKMAEFPLLTGYKKLEKFYTALASDVREYPKK